MLQRLDEVARRWQELKSEQTSPEVLADRKRLLEVVQEARRDRAGGRGLPGVPPPPRGGEGRPRAADRGRRPRAARTRRGGGAAPVGRARRARERTQAPPAAHRPQRPSQRGARGAGGHGRRGGRAVRRRAAADVHPLRRGPPLAGQRDRPVRGRHGRGQGGAGAHRGRGRVLPAQVRVGGAPGAARPGHRGVGTHPHLRGHRRRDARSGGDRDRGRPEGPAHRHASAPPARAGSR